MALRPAGREDDRLTAEERVVLVDRNDRELGTEEKLRAHESGALHRAISVFVFDAHGRVLLQRRAKRKYHSAGKWSNTCCSHPRPGETPVDAAHRRLVEEMGISCELTRAFSFIYRAELDRGLIEHELDHVFVGTFTGTPTPDATEVASWGWMPMSSLIADCASVPEEYSAWLPIALDEMIRQRLPDRLSEARVSSSTSRATNLANKS